MRVWGVVGLKPPHLHTPRTRPITPSLPRQNEKERSLKKLETQFFLPMIPPTVTAQQHRAIGMGKGKKTAYFDTPELKDARDKFEAFLFQQRPPAPLQGAVRLVTKWCFPMIAASHHGQYKTTRPDTDNLVKLFKDCMTRVGFWKDDAQVASETIEKFYSETPGIWVCVSEIKDVIP